MTGLIHYHSQLNLDNCFQLAEEKPLSIVWQDYKQPEDWIKNFANLIYDNLSENTKCPRNNQSKPTVESITRRLNLHLIPTNNDSKHEKLRKPRMWIILGRIYAIMSKSVIDPNLSYKPDEDVMSLAEKLYEGLIQCTAGFENRANLIWTGWAIETDFIYWLETFRTDIVIRFAQNKFKSELDVHMQNAVTKLAEEAKLGIKTIENQDQYSHIKLVAHLKQALISAVQTHYTPLLIIQAIEEQIKRLLLFQGYIGYSAEGYAKGDYEAWIEALQSIFSDKSISYQWLDLDETTSQIHDLQWPIVREAILKKLIKLNVFTLENPQNATINSLFPDLTNKEELRYWALKIASLDQLQKAIQQAEDAITNYKKINSLLLILPKTHALLPKIEQQLISLIKNESFYKGYKTDLIWTSVTHGFSELFQSINNIRPSKYEPQKFDLLGTAIKNGHAEIVRQLINAGANLKQVYTPFGMNYSAIHLAIQYGHLNIVKDLINIDPMLLNAEDRYAQTPLILAGTVGHADIAEFLIQKGANVDAQTKRTGKYPNYTALDFAVTNGHANVASVLLKANANTQNAHGDLKNLPIHKATQQNDLAMLKTLIEEGGVEVDALNGVEQSALLMAAKLGFKDIVAYLISKGANIDREETPDTNRTALYLACKQRHAQVVETLIQAGADTSKAYKTACYKLIHIATINNDIATVKAIIENKPECIFFVDAYGQTPLIFAATKGHIEIVKYLIDKGAFLENKTLSEDDNNGKTPLVWAIDKKFPNLVDLLIKAGADVKTVFSKGAFQPIHLAIIRNDITTVKKLIEANPEVIHAETAFETTPLSLCARQGKIEIAELLIKLGVDVNKASRNYTKYPAFNGKTPLSYAAQYGYKNMAHLLLKAGANPESGNIYGQQAIHAAAENGDNQILNMLLENKPERINAQDHFGETPLIKAIKSNKIYSALFLINKNPTLENATLEPEEDKGKTALYWACEQGMSSIVSLLIKNGARLNPNLVINTKLLNRKAQSQIKILQYLQKKAQEPLYKNQITFFNHKYPIGHSRDEQIHAAEILLQASCNNRMYDARQYLSVYRFSELKKAYVNLHEVVPDFPNAP